MPWIPDVDPHTTEFSVICQAMGEVLRLAKLRDPSEGALLASESMYVAQGLEEYLLRNQKAYSVAKKLYELTGHSEYPFEQLRVNGPLKEEHNESYGVWMTRAQDLIQWLHR